jgi:methylated-DNA-[protein]-cysteine S-methyltransferase
MCLAILPSIGDHGAMEIYAGTMSTPIGRALLVGRDGSLTGLYLDRDANPACEPDEGRLDDVRRQVTEYFDGDRKEFEVPLAPVGTPFQRSVWSALLEIGYGETASYADIARRIGKPTAYRAVGAANGRNPISLIVPCHRVIGAAGALVGYGWGVDRKAWLLAHERGDRDLQLAL